MGPKTVRFKVLGRETCTVMGLCMLGCSQICGFRNFQTGSNQALEPAKMRRSVEFRMPRGSCDVIRIENLRAYGRYVPTRAGGCHKSGRRACLDESQAVTRLTMGRRTARGCFGKWLSPHAKELPSQICWRGADSRNKNHRMAEFVRGGLS